MAPESTEGGDIPPSGGLATLCRLGAFHGLLLTPVELAELVELERGALDPRGCDTLTALHAAHRLGFEVSLLSGTYEELDQVALPCLLVGRDGGTFDLLLSVTPAEATLAGAGSRAGRRLSRAELERRWTGEVIQTVPEPERLARSRARLAVMSDRPRARLLWPIVALGGLGAALLAASAAPHPLSAVAAALLPALSALSLYSGRGDGCAACSRARATVDDAPLGALGAAVYGALTVAALLGQTGLVTAGLGLAFGVHTGLLGALWRGGGRCPRCLAVAGLCAFALTFALVGSRESALVAATLGLFGLFSGVLGLAALGWRRSRRAGQGRAFALIRARGGPATAAGRVRVQVYRREGCSLCTFLERVILPPLQEELPIDLRVDDAGALAISTPFVIVGEAPEDVLVGLQPEDGFERLRSLILPLSRARSAARGAATRGADAGADAGVSGGAR